jgi:hypothetical protein
VADGGSGGSGGSRADQGRNEPRITDGCQRVSSVDYIKFD